MENHPIPQDVTGFKFKLIGSITVKQFLYLLGAGTFCTVIFLLKMNIFLMIPLMTIGALIGVSLAFLPLDGRPMDKMIANFIKTIPSENQYIYRKQGANIFAYEMFRPPHVSTPVQTSISAQATLSNDKKNVIAKRLKSSYFKPDVEEQQYLQNVKSIFQESPQQNAHNAQVQPVQPTAPPAPSSQAPPSTHDQTHPVQIPHIIKEEIEGKKPIASPQQSVAATKPIQQEPVQQETAAPVQLAVNPTPTRTSPDLTEHVKTLQGQLQEALAHKEALQQRVAEMTRAAAGKDSFVPYPTSAQNAPRVKIVTPQTQLQSGFPTLPDIPNVILGIIKDARGKVLPNILVEVVDSKNIPVRTFKTNALGQFASVTSLANGIYKVYFEDPAKNHEFDSIEITLTGEIFRPLEILSEDQREKLRKELFGNQGSV